MAESEFPMIMPFGMEMADGKLPKRLYYTLEQAAERITKETVTADDILHWGATGRVEIVTCFPDKWALCYYEANGNEKMQDDAESVAYEYGEDGGMVYAGFRDNVFFKHILFMAVSTHDCLRIESKTKADVTNRIFFDFSKFFVLSQCDDRVIRATDCFGTYKHMIYKESVEKVAFVRLESHRKNKKLLINDKSELFILNLELERLLAGNPMAEEQSNAANSNKINLSAINPRTENSQSKIIAALALKHYDVPIHENKLIGLERMVDALDSMGVKISNETLSKYIKNGANNIDQKNNK